MRNKIQSVKYFGNFKMQRICGKFISSLNIPAHSKVTEISSDRSFPPANTAVRDVAFLRNLRRPEQG